MASKTIVTCDVCGQDPAETMSVVISGTAREVDLCARHARALDAALRPFLGAGRSASGGRAVAKRAKKKAAAKKVTAKKATKKRAAPKAAKRSKKAAKASGRRVGAGSDVATMRAWGQANGFAVATKGRLKPDVVAAFQAAHRRAA